MPKVTFPSVKTVLIDRQGEPKPIALQVCWKGRKKIKYTGVLIESKYWDPVNSSVSKRYKDFLPLTAQISTLRRRLEKRIMDLAGSGVDYTVDDIFSTGEVVDRKTDYESLYLDLVRSRGLKTQTKRNYDLAYTLLKRYLQEDRIQLSELTADVVQGFCADMTRKGLSGGYAGAMLRCIRAVWNYAIENKLASGSDYPFGDNSTFYKKYKQGTHHTALTLNQVRAIEEYWTVTFWTVDSEGNPVPIPQRTNPQEYYSKFFCLTMWLLSFYMQGLAPVDLLHLKWDQIEIHPEKKMVVFRNVKRRKTGHEVPVVVPYHGTFLLIWKFYNEHRTGEYFLPFYNSKANLKNPEVSKNNFLSTCSRTLKDMWVEINVEMMQRKLDGRIKDWVDIPRSTTLYSARHTFATSYLTSNNANIVALSTMMGRSVEGIGVYVKELRDDDYILAERLKVGGVFLSDPAEADGKAETEMP